MRPKYASPSITGQRLKQNNFDFLRLLFAATVCLVHSYDLSGFAPLSPIAGTLSSAIAVKAFFVVSGFLIFMSYERSPSLTDYAGKRFRRIYPAYFTVVMLCAFGMAVVSTQSLSNYFSLAWLKYVFANLSFLNFLQPTLPGVFDINKLAAVNGALWTLKIEAMFYLTVPLFVWGFRRLSPLPVLVFVYVVSVAYVGLLSSLAEKSGVEIYNVLGRQLPGQLSYFMAGAFFYYFQAVFVRGPSYFLVPAIATLILNAYHPLPLLEPFALATVVIYFGLFHYLGNFGKFGDFSYGVYILHFPTIQLLLNTGWFADAPWLYLVSLLILTSLSAVTLWHMVEKRFLFRSSHYISATEEREVQTSRQESDSSASG